MDIKPPRAQWMKAHPISYRMQLPVNMLGCGNSSEYPVPWADTRKDKYSFIGWLMMQHGVPAKKLCIAAATRVVVVRNSMVPKGQVEIPSPLRWLASDECAVMLGEEIRGSLPLLTPCCLLGEPDPHGNDVSQPLCKTFELLDSINNAKVAMAKDGSIVNLDLPTRIFWLREVCRKHGVGVQVL